MLKEADRQYLIDLGIRIAKLRQAKGVDQKQFAFECGISRTQLYMIETGKTNPRVLTLDRIAEGLDMRLSELLNVG